ncbi:hypothetical protein LCGC14_1927630 [marine sediment metagenome]|uniref:Uncharacterized protein n=1 Tax=marine sediment metagenome TaxID=412755 RepID=A0A0F9GC80_9ZZZZ
MTTLEIVGEKALYEQYMHKVRVGIVVWLTLLTAAVLITIAAEMEVWTEVLSEV